MSVIAPWNTEQSYLLWSRVTYFKVFTLIFFTSSFIVLLSCLIPVEMLWMLLTGRHRPPLKQNKVKSFMLPPFSESLGVSLFYLPCLSVCALFWQELLAWFWSYLKHVKQNKASCLWVRRGSKRPGTVHGGLYCQEFHSDSQQKGILNQVQLIQRATTKRVK